MSAEMPSVEEAMSVKKLMVHFDCTLPEGVDRRELLAAFYRELRRRRPEIPGNSQDELLWFKEVSSGREGLTWVVRYVFDHDFASMYDKTDTSDIELHTDLDGGNLVVVRWLNRGRFYDD